MMVTRYGRLLLVIAILLVGAGTIATGLGRPGYMLKLDFTNSNGVVKGADVTIAGVNGGKVESLGVKGKVAVVVVTIDSKFAPIHSGAKALVRSVGLLGHKYVEVIDGKGSGTIASGSELSINSTTSPTDLDQLNAIFDAPTREKLKTLTLEGQIALGGRAQVINDDLRQLRNLAVAAEPVAGVLDQHQVALDRATVAFDTLTQKLVREDASLRVLVENGSSLLAAVNARDQELSGLLIHGGSTFSSLNTALTSNEGNLAGFFARGPSGMTSTDYQLNASIPAIRVTTPVLPNLFELLYNMADATTSRDGPGDPHNPNSGTQWNLRVVALPCIQTTTAPATC